MCKLQLETIDLYFHGAFFGFMNFLAVAGSVIDFTLSVLQFATFRTLPRQLHHGGHLGLKLHPDFIESAIGQKNMAVNPALKKRIVWDWGINPV